MKNCITPVVLLLIGLGTVPAMGDLRFNGEVTEGGGAMFTLFSAGLQVSGIALFQPGSFADDVANADEMGGVFFTIGSTCWTRQDSDFCSVNNYAITSIDYANIFANDVGLTGQLEFTGCFDPFNIDVEIAVDMVAQEFTLTTSGAGFLQGTVLVDMYDDFDGDAAIDPFDNCVRAFNPAQYDADSDGFGNACDPDFNNDCIVNFLDAQLFAEKFMSNDPVYDLDENGSVGFSDYAVLRDRIFQQPGPVGTIETTICGPSGR